jgi:DNA mismatch endonuclease (patch repair protein)
MMDYPSLPSFTMDNVGKRRRSEIMSNITSVNTAPEKAVRSMIHRMGYRFRLHPTSLPGKPDIVLPRHKKVILVHGCFWHGHLRCLKGKPPKSNLDFWLPKLAANRKRDRIVAAKLRRLGWGVLVIWQCQLRRPEFLQAGLRAFLNH